MSRRDKNRVLLTIALIGIICIFIVVISAYSAELRCENNDLIASNEALQGDIDTLSIQIKSVNNIDHIESVATKKLGMIYPSDGECVNISESKSPEGNFAMSLREEAYN